MCIFSIVLEVAADPSWDTRLHGSRAMLAASNSAMWIAAPEMYPTPIRGVGANTAFLMNVLGSVPAPYFVYSNAPRWMVAGGVCGANLLVAALAYALPETAGVSLDEPLT